MASAWYMGTAAVRTITADQWAAAGVPNVATTTWSVDNGWSIPLADLTAAQLAVLDNEGLFWLEAPDGPRTVPDDALAPEDPLPMYVRDSELFGPDGKIRLDRLPPLVAGPDPEDPGAEEPSGVADHTAIRDWDAAVKATVTDYLQGLLFQGMDFTTGTDAEGNTILAGGVLEDQISVNGKGGSEIVLVQDDILEGEAFTRYSKVEAAKLAALGAAPDVRRVRLTGTAAAALVSTGPTDWVDIPSALVDDAASGDAWALFPTIVYRADAATGIQIRPKGQAATPTNRLPNPSADTDASGWNSNSLAASASAVTRSTASGPYPQGSAGFRITVDASVTTANNVAVWSDWIDTTEGLDWSARALLKRISSTARTVRVDVQYGGPTATNASLGTGVTSATLGTGITPGTTGFTAALAEGSVVPVGSTKVRLRIVILGALAGDVFEFDAAQLEPSATVPAYGTTGGGAGVLNWSGSWSGPSDTGTPGVNGYDHRTVLRGTSPATHVSRGLGATTDAELTGAFDVTLPSEGTLAGQRIEWQFASHATGSVSLMAVMQTAARVVSSQ